MQKLKICILLPDFYDPGMPARPAVTEIYGNCFPRLGHNVTWITPGTGKGKEIQEVLFGDVRILIIPCETSSFPPRKVLTTAIFLWKQSKLVSDLIRRRNCNIIQVRNNILQALIALYLKNKFRVPFVFQYSFPAAGAALRKYRVKASRLSRVMGRASHFVLPFIMKHADLVLPISRWMFDELARNGIKREKMFPVPLAVNTELFSPTVDGRQIRLKYNLIGSKVLIYQGTMDKLRQLGVLFYALAKVKQKRRNVRLLMVGDGDDRADLESLAYNLGLENEVIFTGQVPYFQVSQFIAAANIGLSPIPPLDIYKVSSPCKLFEYMGVAIPVIANKEILEPREVLEQSGGGILVPFIPEAFAGAISELLDNPEKAIEMGERGREWVVKHRTYEILAQQVEKRYFELLTDK